MEARAKEQFGDLESGLDLWSAKDGGDSNAIILPGKRMSKKKGKNQVREHLRTKNIPKLTKSQKRKLHKIEEEKEKTILLSESIETLEKYKIQDAAYALMWSSRNLGQVETVRERRRREVQFSKAGLALPHSDKPFKRKVAVSPSCEIEPDSETVQSTKGLVDLDFQQPVMAKKEVTSKTSFVYSKESVSSNGIGAVDRYAAIEPVEEIANQNDETCISEDARDSLPMTFNYYRSESNSPMGQAVESQKRHISMTTNLADCPLPVVLCPPVVVHVSRPKEVESSRKDLPIVMFEQEIMEAINENSTVIICGETGCGKTTQVPQFLYEAGFGSAQSGVRSGIIGVTQPRRIAVLETAKRVSFELFGRLPGKEVGFQVRHDRRVGNKCAIKFMTDGILLREVQSDFLLRKYSIIILDEAHQRSVHTDILVGMLSRVVQARQNIYEEQQLKALSGERISAGSQIFPLKLVLMSATLRVDDFVSGRRIFPNPPPVIEVPTRQFPVTVHFSKQTEIVNYIGQAYKKVLSIHKRLPPGGILVFVTGQKEVEDLCRMLRKTSKELFENSSKRNLEKEVSKITAGNAIEENVMKEISEACEMPGTSQTDRFSSYEDDPGDLDDELNFCEDIEMDSDLEGTDDVDLLNHESETIGDLSEVFRDEGRVASLTAAFEVLAGKTTLNPDSDEKQVLSSTPESWSNQSIADEGEKRGAVRPRAGAMRVLPLYSMLPESESRRVFEGTREGERLVVVATNVAETSLTIPGVKYVVDTGREKVKNYNSSNGIETYEVQWISKASAAQRAGRAGRTAPGHCYRLYSSAVFNNIFPDFSSAAISKVPVDDIVLVLKSMGVCKVSNFPFPTPPEVNALTEAERCLTILEALDSNGILTPLGKAMAHYPMRPRHSRMLLTVIQIMKKVKSYERANLVLGYAVAAAASLSYPNPFVFQLEGSRTDMDGLKQDKEKSVDKEGELGRKKLKGSAKLSRAKFANPHSDVLTIAYALQCFELSTTQVEFCNDHSLNFKAMKDISKLRKQLLQLLFHQSSNDLQQDFSWTHGTLEDVENAWMVFSDKDPLLLNEEELLCQAICAGWADRVAKRVRGVSASEGDRKVNAARYQACMVKETVFLPRWSSVSKFAPEFLVYSELLYTKRRYMQVVTGVKSDWLVKYAKSQCTFPAPLADPKPYYDPLTDQVFSWVVPSFGPHRWELPLHSVPIVDVGRRVAVFSASLLEGNVLPCLRSVKKFMAATPANILRPEGAVQRRVGNLLNKLNSRLRVIDSCAMLREAWDENPKELYLEILDWFQEGFHDQFEDLWAKMHHEVLLDPKERFPKRFKREKGDITL